MQAPAIQNLTDITPAQWQIAFDAAMKATEFNGLIHRLYQAMELKWYTGPNDSRELAQRLFNSLMESLFSDGIYTFPRANPDKTSLSSGCLKVTLRVYEKNYQCSISFDPANANGLGFIHRR